MQSVPVRLPVSFSIFFSSYLFFYIIPDYYACPLPFGQSLLIKTGIMDAFKRYKQSSRNTRK